MSINLNFVYVEIDAKKLQFLALISGYQYSNMDIKRDTYRRPVAITKSNFEMKGNKTYDRT